MLAHLTLQEDGSTTTVNATGFAGQRSKRRFMGVRIRKIRQRRFVLDGEAAILGVDGIADFNAPFTPA
jgi:hypothetical protein